MALIDCVECGGKVSDKAQACPACGCPIGIAPSSPVAQEVCPECNSARTDMTQENCKNCGYPFPLKKNPTPTKEDNKTCESLIIEFLQSYNGPTSKNIFYGQNLDSSVVQKHIDKYLILSPGEKVLIALNKSAIIGNVFSGLAITNTHIHYRAVKKSLFSGMIPKTISGKEKLAGIHSLSLGNHDTALGTAYVGHELHINGIAVGYVRMGAGIMYDEEAINLLTQLFDYLHSKGVIKNKITG